MRDAAIPLTSNGPAAVGLAEGDTLTLHPHLQRDLRLVGLARLTAESGATVRTECYALSVDVTPPLMTAVVSMPLPDNVSTPKPNA